MKMSGLIRGCAGAVLGFAISMSPGFMPAALAQRVDIVVAAEPAPLEQFAARELQRYVDRLFGVKAAIVTEPTDAPDYRFVVSSADHVPGVALSSKPLPALSEQGFVLRASPVAGKPSLLVVGGSPVAVMWGVYDLVERWGVRYLLSGDVFPETPKPFALPNLDAVVEPVFRIRMWKTMGDFAMGMEGWGMADYRPFLDQLAKLKFNRIRISSGPTQPFLKFEVPGIERQTATLWYGEHFPITDDMPGRSLFGDEKEFWNPDLPMPEAGPAAMVEAGVRHCRELIAYAHSRGLASNFVGALTDFPREYAPVVPGAQTISQLGELTVGPGPSALPDNPELRKIAGIVLRSIVDTYPEVETYGFPVGTEWPSWVDLYDWSWKYLDERYALSDVTTLDAVLQAAGRRTEFTGGAERAVRQVKGDLAGLCFIDVLRHDPDILPPSRKPNPTIMYYEISEELFPILGRILPDGSELSIVLDYTPTRVLRRKEVIKTVPEPKVPTILALTLQDDGVGVPPQLTTGSIHTLVTAMREARMAGFCTRQWMISDLDPTVAYLARAAWDAGVTPEAAYRDMIASVCGEPAVEPMLEAFREIEKVTLGIEDHGLGLGFPVPNLITRHWSPGAMDPPYVEDREGYRRALAAVKRVPEPATDAGRAYVRYWEGRLAFGIGFFDTIEAARRAATAEQAAQDAAKAGDAAAAKAKAGEAANLADAAAKTAYEAIDAFARVARNRADAGAVATMAEYMFRPLQRKAKALREG